jgi:hypothetical protein
MLHSTASVAPELLDILEKAMKEERRARVVPFSRAPMKHHVDLLLHISTTKTLVFGGGAPRQGLQRDKPFC